MPTKMSRVFEVCSLLAVQRLSLAEIGGARKKDESLTGEIISSKIQSLRAKEPEGEVPRGICGELFCVCSFYGLTTGPTWYSRGGKSRKQRHPLGPVASDTSCGRNSTGRGTLGGRCSGGGETRCFRLQSSSSWGNTVGTMLR